MCRACRMACSVTGDHLAAHANSISAGFQQSACMTDDQQQQLLATEIDGSADCQDAAEQPGAPSEHVRKTPLVRFSPLSLPEVGADLSPAQSQDQHPDGSIRNFEFNKRGRIVQRGVSVCGEPARRPALCRQRRISDSGGPSPTPPARLGLRRSSTLPEPATEVADVPPATLHAPSARAGAVAGTRHVLVLGAAGVGKSALRRQFQVSETGGLQSSGYESDAESHNTQRVRVCLNGSETQLLINTVTCNVHSLPAVETLRGVSVLVVVYSVVDAESFATARALCQAVAAAGPGTDAPPPPPAPPVILVASKCDLVRRRKVTTKDGRALALEFGFKYVETSVVINANVDELLAGIVAQIHLRSQVGQPCRQPAGQSKSQRRHQRSSRRLQTRTLPSLLVKEILHRVIGQKESRSCDNLMTV